MNRVDIFGLKNYRVFDDKGFLQEFSNINIGGNSIKFKCEAINYIQKVNLFLNKWVEEKK